MHGFKRSLLDVRRTRGFVGEIVVSFPFFVVVIAFRVTPLECLEFVLALGRASLDDDESSLSGIW